MTNFRFPKIDAPTPQGQIQQIQRYLYQLVNDIQMEFSAVNSSNSASTGGQISQQQYDELTRQIRRLELEIEALKQG